ncbi:NAD(P)-dependent oxidoreductase [Haloarcula amylovorans]|uniref:NAD(P)-dependent oxidoreductase n=1 Tax=Haloarcula amylovorans TaxID=2562280 RepID=UPI00107650F0|nr:NAD(P)-binding domain-containing protein [Halomicroarcula amylolytica]
MASNTIGFIGTGIMGKPMAENVIDAGYSVIAHNRSQEPVERLVNEGAQAATSPAEVTRKSDIVVTVLPDTDAVTSVVRGDDGILQALSDGQIFVDMSTISPAATERLAADVGHQGAEMLDAPISGGEEGAIEGTLSIMVGGSEETFDAVYDLFETMGETITRCGDSGAGQVTKAANQIIVGCQHQAVAEALLLAKQGGADLEQVLEAISGGAAACWSLDARAPRVIRGNFEPGFFSSYHYKDLRIAMDAGEEYGTPMPATGIVHEMYKAMEQTERGQDDHSGVIQIIEDLAGEKARIDE